MRKKGLSEPQWPCQNLGQLGNANKVDLHIIVAGVKTTVPSGIVFLSLFMNTEDWVVVTEYEF